MPSLNELLSDYIQTYPDLIAEDIIRSGQRVREQNINFEHQRFVDHMPAPYLLHQSRFDQLRQQGEHLLKALNRVVKGYRHDQRIRRYFGHLERFEKFLSLPTPLYPIISIARFDLVETMQGDFRVVEPNTCCPGGAIWTSMFYEIFKESNVYSFLKNHAKENATPLQNGDTIYNYLIEEYERHFGAQDAYGIVLADTRSAPMETELFELRDGARARGHAAEKTCIQDLRFDGTSLTLGDMPVHIVYQFLDVLFTNDMAQIAENYDEIADFLRAIENRKVLVVNPFPPLFISEDKSILELLQDPNFADLFDKTEHEAIAALVPETYRLNTGKVAFEGSQTDLITLLKSRKNDFVIKAQMESMGRDITIGRTIRQQQWEQLIDLKLGGLYIAQRFIEEAPLQLPFKNAEIISLQPMYYTLTLFLLGGKAVGMCNRVSPHLVTNVGQGGAWGEVFVYE
jgi:uncharacterized circularly permuted ATP-grasp superfamily protein